MSKEYICIAISILFGAFAQVLMKLGTMQKSIETTSLVSKIIQTVFTPSIFFGLSLYAVSAILWIFGISKIPLSQAYPMVACSYVIVFILSVIIFKEVITLQKIAGLAIIIVGVLVIAKA